MCPWHRKMFPTADDVLVYAIQDTIAEAWDRIEEERENETESAASSAEDNK